MFSDPTFSILENVPHALEKSVYSGAIGWNILYMSVIMIGAFMLYRLASYLLIFSLDKLFIVQSGISKSYTSIVVLFLCWIYFQNSS